MCEVIAGKFSCLHLDLAFFNLQSIRGNFLDFLIPTGSCLPLSDTSSGFGDSVCIIFIFKLLSSSF